MEFMVINMRKSISWHDKYLLCLKEGLSIKEIMNLCEVGSSKASNIRSKAINYCLEYDIPIYSRFVPTEAVLSVINRDIEYYANKMTLESKACLGVI